MSKITIRLSELKAKKVSNRVYVLAERRIKGGYNGNIELLIKDCANTVNFESEHYAY